MPSLSACARVFLSGRRSPVVLRDAALASTTRRSDQRQGPSDFPLPAHDEMLRGLLLGFGDARRVLQSGHEACGCERRRRVECIGQKRQHDRRRFSRFDVQYFADSLRSKVKQYSFALGSIMSLSVVMLPSPVIDFNRCRAFALLSGESG